MAQLYTLIYTCTNQENTRISQGGHSGSRTYGISNFVVSGDGVGHKIREVVSVKVRHTHSVHGTYGYSINMRATLNGAEGSAASPLAYLAFNSSGAKTQTSVIDPAVATPEILNTLQSVTIRWNSYNSGQDLYGRATSDHPMIITIQFYSGETVFYGDNGQWQECEVYEGADGAWHPCGILYGTGGEWIEV